VNVSDLINNPNLNKDYGYLQGHAAGYYGQEKVRVTLSLAELKGKIVKKKATPNQQDFWQSIPTVSADAQVGDVVKDYSIDPNGQAGVVFEVRDMRKRNGSIVTLIEFGFYGHTNLQDLRTRKIEFKKS
jgi:hypothetical protein